MKDDFLSRARRISTRRAAAAFSDPLRHRLILMFAGGERSVSEIAEMTGVELKRLHYHVNALRNLGLITVARRQRRAGRAIKFYRAVADAFFVPAALAPAPVHAGLDAELRDALEHVRDRASEGTLFYAAEDGTPRMRLVRGPSTGVVHAERWQRLRLSRADAARCIAEMEGLLKAFAPDKGTAGESYLFHFAIAPARTKR